jgi:hypothetical protein
MKILVITMMTTSLGRMTETHMSALPQFVTTFIPGKLAITMTDVPGAIPKEETQPEQVVVANTEMPRTS